MTARRSPELTAAELASLQTIAVDLRHLARGLVGPGQSVANAVARRGGIRPHASLRALVAMEDLRRPSDVTLRGLAVGVGIPERADAWIAAWRSIPHPSA